MTSSVKSVDVRRPPMMTQAMELRTSAPAVRERAVGSIPTIIVKVVIRIGRRRSFPASRTAAAAGIPSRCISVSV